ncbi:hypothetical protein [Victivallis vadensis]|jgi:hypothetical protein|uniref:Uncharacterized protein n=1 Tax=Victivallis vadensis TaxID=172901 RepID=A0A2U1BBE9_9BACT|nr:hypothetical protein [Victivallis vadensis]NMD87464.1 hypothetical protein [Victivallis vadensis]PVY45978.1 hypothetical protein C8D82_101176 [Victivallis vadensis]HJH05707.1 hypothetical protein [Victivallis vadensis]
MIKEAWEVMGFSYLLTIIVSLLVAVVIHGMTVLIRRFGAKAAPLPASAVQEPVVPVPDDPDEVLAVVLAASIRMQRNPEGK